MFRRSVHRLTTTVLVVLSLLFSQLALANYVCPERAQDIAYMSAMQMSVGEPCESMVMASGKAFDQDQPVLCHQHCIDAPQSVDGVQIPTVSLPAVVHVLPMLVVLDARAEQSIGFARSQRERPPPDPLFLSTLRLRV